MGTQRPIVSMYDNDDDDSNNIRLSYGIFNIEHINSQNITQPTVSDHQFSVVINTVILSVSVGYAG